MPTGYTARLETLKFDTKTWLLRDVIRAFGCCVVLRDEGELSFDEMKNALEKTYNDDIKYHEENIVEAKKRLKEYKELSDKEWKAREKKDQEEHFRKNVESRDKMLEKKKGYEVSLYDISLLDENAPDELKNIFKFVREQINDTIEHDCDVAWHDQHTINSVPTKKDYIETAKRDVEYHTEEKEKVEKRKADSLGFFERYYKYINDTLK